MIFKKRRINNSAVSAVMGTILMCMLTFFLIGTVSVVFTNQTGSLQDEMTNPMITVLTTPITSGQEFTVSTVSSNMDWSDITVRLDGVEIDPGMTGPIYAGDTFTLEKSGTVSISYSPLNKLLYSHTITSDSSEPPAKPCGANPIDGVQIDDVNVVLSVYVYDPDTTILTVSFYDKDGILIDDTIVESGTQASIQWNDLIRGSTYEWYAIVSDGTYDMISDKWQFSIIENIDWWPMFRHDVQHTGFSSSQAIDDSIKWVCEDLFMIESSPAIVDGKIYFGNRNGTTYCLDSGTGEILWATPAEQAETDIWSSSPAVVNGLVYIGNYYSKTVYCYDASSGVEEWSTYLGPGANIDSSPMVVDGYVYIGAHDGKLYKLKAETGEKSILYQVYPLDHIDSTPVIVDGKAYFCSNNGKFYCIDIDNGLKYWEYSYGQSSPWMDSSPTVVDGKVYVGMGIKLLCLDANSGELIWLFDDVYDRIQSSPAYAYGNIYISCTYGYFYCINATTGELQWKYDTNGETYASPAVADGRVYIGNVEGYFYCFNAEVKIGRDPEVIWQYYIFGDEFMSSPGIADGNVFIPTRDGTVICFGD